MRDRWDQLSDANREDSALSESDATSALLNVIERLQHWKWDRQSQLNAATSAWRYLDAFLDEIGVSRDELFAAVCSQVDPQLLAEVNADTDSTDKAVEHIRGDAPSKAHDRVRVFLDVWKGWGSSVSHSIVWTGTKYGEPGHPLLHLEDLEQVLVDLESQQPVEEINEATVVVLTAIEGNVALAAEVLNVVDAYPTTREAADSTRDHIDDAVEFMSDLPKTMTGLDSTDPAITLLDVNLDDVDWIKVAETVLGWGELGAPPCSPSSSPPRRGRYRFSARSHARRAA